MVRAGAQPSTDIRGLFEKEKLRMIILQYRDMSRKERRAAKKLAKELLWTVPAAETPAAMGTLRGAFASAFMKPENVVGAMIYGDSYGHWWGDIVLKKGHRILQMGSSEREPPRSRDQALECIASIKAMQEDPIIQRIREMGMDPALLELLRVDHQELGRRWILMDEERFEESAASFADFLRQNEVGPGPQSLELARQIVFDHAGQFATNPEDLLERDGAQIATCLGFQAAGFLLANGVMNVDDRDLPEISGIPEINVTALCRDDHSATID